MDTEHRLDYPMCPYCGHHLALFFPPEGIERATLYCRSGSCRGRSLYGAMNGYDIKLTDITSGNDHQRYTPFQRWIARWVMPILRGKRSPSDAARSRPSGVVAEPK